MEELKPMIKETMDPVDRIKAAVRFEETDRTPLVLAFCSPLLGKLKGLTPAESYRNLPLVVEAEEELWKEFGGWDLRYGPIGLHDIGQTYPFGAHFWSIPRAMPGVDLPDYADVQNREIQLMGPDGYDRLKEMGWYAFWCEQVNTTYHRNLTVEQAKSTDFMKVKVERAKKWSATHGTQVLYSASVMDPVNLLSTWRTASDFLLDLRYQPKKVHECVHDVIMPIFLKAYEAEVRACECDVVMVPAATFQQPFINADNFEVLQGDWIRGCNDIILGEGKIPVYHLDSNWDESIYWFKENVPYQKGIMHLGGETDIFKAKEILGDHMCLMGDASCVAMQVCRPDEIRDYYKKLVDVIGADNGYIMCEGCFLSAHTNLDNVRAIVEVAKNYKPR